MSQYIPNFLYEPIARQARRFSSPNTAETAEQRGTRHGTLVGVPEPSMAGQAEEASGPIAGGDQYVASILGQPVMLSPTTASGGLEAELRGLQPHEAFNSSWNRNATVVSDQYTAIVRTDSNSEGVLPQADSDVINNPTRRFTERFRSTNTSISSSINDTGLTNSRSPGTSRRNTTQDGNSASAGTYAVDGVLPEDDGMRTMRNKILQIQSRDISNHEKSRLMHELMTHQYSSYHPNLLLHAIPRARSPNSIRSQDRPLTPNSYLSISDTMQSSLPQTSASSIADREDICQVTSEDIKPTYWIPQARTATADDSSELMVPEQTTNSGPQESYNDQEMPLGCAHYKRNWKTTHSTAAKPKVCFACCVDVLKLPQEIAKIAATQQPITTVEFANFGKMIPIRAYITAMIVEFAESAKDLEGTSTTVKHVAFVFRS
ncbi:hypothetical protein MMC13_004013 [Lambiella insularis]|nr:hypothetical protein [Lambiella insularis]